MFRKRNVYLANWLLSKDAEYVLMDVALNF